MELAGVEFGRDHRALSKRIRREGLEPGEDGCFSTAQICAAVFGDQYSEDLRKTREEADKLEIHNKRSRRELIDAESVYRHFEAWFIIIRQRILASKMTRDEQDDLLRELKGITYEQIKGARIGDGERKDKLDPDAAATADLP